MVKNTKYYTLNRGKKKYILSGRMAINWTEVILFPIPFFVVLLLFGGVVPAVIITPLMFLLYFLFRYTAAVYYKDYAISLEDKQFTSTQMLFGKPRHLDLIDKKFNIQKIQFIEINRGGMVKYLLRYVNQKNYDLLIVRSEKDKKEIVDFFNDV
jgi:hypothetical protein